MMRCISVPLAVVCLCSEALQADEEVRQETQEEVQRPPMMLLNNDMDIDMYDASLTATVRP